ncbi:MAG: siphovirus Gp157 family protein [bacterium]
MPSLEEIELEIKNILEMDYDIPEEEYETYLDYLKDLYKQEKSKIDAIGFNIRRFKSDIDFLKQEEHRINNKRKSMEKRLDSFKNYIKNVLLEYKIDKIKGDITSIYFMNTSSVLIEDIDKIPEDYVTTKIEKIPDKKAIKQFLKEGGEIVGAELKSNKSLVIR